MIQVPFSKFELLEALNGLGDPESKEMEELALKIGQIGKELCPADKALRNSKIASWQGITLEVLVNSSNYVLLCEQYDEYSVKVWVERMQKEFNLTEQQAWAIIAGIKGLLD